MLAGCFIGPYVLGLYSKKVNKYGAYAGDGWFAGDAGHWISGAGERLGLCPDGFRQGQSEAEGRAAHPGADAVPLRPAGRFSLRSIPNTRDAPCSSENLQCQP